MIGYGRIDFIINTKQHEKTNARKKDTRLIETAFPLKQASLDSVHEKNVRHGHISTLHTWPARRPLAACRAALFATLLPDPGTPEKRKELCEKIGGKVEERIERKKMPGGRIVERVKEATQGGILHWKRESENAETLEWFRQEIRKAYGGRAPKVLDPFASGGSIPLEAMRLGCEATARDCLRHGSATAFEFLMFLSITHFFGFYNPKRLADFLGIPHLNLYRELKTWSLYQLKKRH